MRAMSLIFGLLVLQQTSSRSLPEDSVVSVYPPNSNGTHLDVYHLIANNLAERITSPIYRFLGFNRTATSTTTHRAFSKIEIVDDAEVTTKYDVNQLNNDILHEKDVEELSPDALKKIDKKPEKITLYSSYLPAKQTELNETANEVDADVETFGFDDDIDDDSEATPRQSPFIFVLELIGSFFQLVYGGLSSLFSSSSSSQSK